MQGGRKTEKIMVRSPEMRLRNVLTHQGQQVVMSNSDLQTASHRGPRVQLHLLVGHVPFWQVQPRAGLAFLPKSKQAVKRVQTSGSLFFVFLLGDQSLAQGSF